MINLSSQKTLRLRLDSVFAFVWLLLFVSTVLYPWWLILQSVALALIIQGLTVLVIFLSYSYFQSKLKGLSLTFNIGLRSIIIFLALGIVYLLANMIPLLYPFMNTDEDFEILSGVLFRVPLDVLSGKTGIPAQFFYIAVFLIIISFFVGAFHFMRRIKLQKRVHTLFFIAVPLILVGVYTLMVFGLFHLFQPTLLPDFQLSNIGWLVKYPELGGIINSLVLLLDFDFIFSIRVIQFVFAFLSIVFFYNLLRLFVNRNFSVVGAALLALNPLFFKSASLGVKVGCVSFVMIASSYFLIKYFSGEGEGRIVFFYLSMFFMVVGILLKEPIILFCFFCMGISAFYFLYSEIRSCKRKSSKTKLIFVILNRLLEKMKANKQILLFSAVVIIIAIRRQVTQSRFLDLTLAGGYHLFPNRLFSNEVYSGVYRLSGLFLGESIMSFVFIILLAVMVVMFFRTSKFKYLFIPAWAVSFFFFTVMTVFTYDFKSMLFYVPPLIVALVLGVYLVCSLPWWRSIGRFVGIALLFVYMLFIANSSFGYNFIDRTLDLYPLGEYYDHVASPKFENSSVVQLFPVFYVYEYYAYPGISKINHSFMGVEELVSVDYDCNEGKYRHLTEKLKSDDVDYVSLLYRGTDQYVPGIGFLTPLNDAYACLMKDKGIKTESEFTFGSNKVVLLRVVKI
jgi:hypothetical protein